MANAVSPRLIPLALALVLGAAAGAGAADADATRVAAAGTPSVGDISNFGPNLQQAAGGVCRQPEGLAIDRAGNLYASSNSDTATTVGHVCVIDPAGRLTDVIDVPAGAVPAIGLLGELWTHGRLYLLDQADDTAPHGRLLVVDPTSHAVRTLADGFAFPTRSSRTGPATSTFRTPCRAGSTGSRQTHRPDRLGGQCRAAYHQSDQPVGCERYGIRPDRPRALHRHTGNRQILRIPVNHDGSAGPVTVFADGRASTTDRRCRARRTVRRGRYPVRCAGQSLRDGQPGQRGAGAGTRR